MKLMTTSEELVRQELRNYYMDLPSEAQEFEHDFDYPEDYDWVLLEGGVIMSGYDVEHADMELIVAGCIVGRTMPKGQLKLVHSAGLTGVDQLRLNMKAYDKRVKKQDKNRQGKNDRVKPLGRF